MYTGTRLTTAIYRRLFSRFFLKEGERLYLYTGYWIYIFTISMYIYTLRCLYVAFRRICVRDYNFVRNGTPYSILSYRRECFTGKYTTRKIHKNYIRDPSGLFSIISHVSLSIT